jgi:shikimate dehydrogenase
MTDRYALFGLPLGHTKSPLIHGEFARQTGQDLTYEAIEAPADGFAQAVDRFRAAGGRGINVTLPFKLEAVSYATDLMERARLAGAVNCMKFDGDRATAELRRPRSRQRHSAQSRLRCAAGASCSWARAARTRRAPALLRTGAGAARRRQPYGFEGHGTRQAVSDLRQPRHGRLRRRFRPPVRHRGQRDVCEPPRRAAPGAASRLCAAGLAYDLVYGKGLTPFLHLAQEAGAGRVADGIGMLIEQAAEAFVWWRGVRPVTQPLIEKLSVPLS